MAKWPACKIRQTEAGSVTQLAFAGTRQTKREFWIAGYCENPGGGFRVELRVRPADMRQLAETLLAAAK